MDRRSQLTVAAIAVLVAGGAAYLYSQMQGPPAEAPKAPAAAPPAPQIEHPVAPVKGEPLPSLADSDGAAAAALASLLQAPSLPDVFYPDRIVRRWVATIDNLPREQVAPEVRVVRPPEGALATRGEDASLAIAPDNSARYAHYMSLLAAADVGQTAALYRRFYPLFQSAYEELGYPGKYFNDRLIAVIDHLLATPDVAEPIRLVHPSVMYKFADPKLESLSAGQKALLRLGRENTQQVKAKLRALRAEIVGVH